MKTDIRLNTDNDIDDLVQFWNENSGWDIIDRKEWEKRFYITPHGPASIVLVIDDSNKILGQFIFIPTRVSVDGKVLNAYRPFAPVVRADIRTLSGIVTLFDYVQKMYKFAMKSFIEQGVFIIHMLPDPRWARAFKILKGTRVDSFPLWSVPMENLVTFSIPSEYSVENIKADDERINALWEKTSKLYNCSMVRDASVLPWKLSHGNYQINGIIHQSTLVGLSASIYKEQNKQWLICDVLAENEKALEITLKAACNQALTYKLSLADGGVNLKKVAILATPMIEKIISGLRFIKEAYKFPVVIHVLDSKTKREELNPDRWYFSAND